MKGRIKLLLIGLFVLFYLHEVSMAFDFLPRPKETRFSEAKTVSVNSTAKIVFPVGLRNEYPHAMSELNKTLSTLPRGNAEFTITASQAKDIPEDSIPKRASKVFNKTEGYWIHIKEKEIKITGSDLMGVIHGLATLEYSIKKNSGRISEGEIFDWPDHKIRAFHFVLRPGVKYEDAKKFLINKLRFGHYTTIVLAIYNWVEFDSLAGKITQFKRWNKKEHKWKSIKKGEKPWAKEQLTEFVNIARGLGMDAVAEISFLTHQDTLLQDKFPQFMYNNVTYDPRKDEIYSKIVFPLIDEMVDLIDLKAIHIGHDEVAGHNDRSRKRWLKQGEQTLPAELFLKDVVKIHNHLKSRGIDTWMWGDMLIGKREFPGMFQKHLHGNDAYISIRARIPKDIVICDWHYFDKQKEFPSARLFADLGHRVIGATWHKERTIRNFSRYMANLPKNGEGMIASTWFSVQNKGWRPLEEIAAKSAEAFWNAR